MMGEASAEHFREDELARRAQGGCADSFEQLVRRFQVPLLRFLRPRVTCDADAEDLVQETFIRAYQRLDRYRDRWRFSTWLFTIAHRLWVSHHRGATSRQALHEGAAVQARSSKGEPFDAAVALARSESNARLWEVAKHVLSDEQFAAVWLYYVEGMDTRDLARVLDRSWVSVKTMLFRARAKLMPFLNDWTDAGMGAPARAAERGPRVPVQPMYRRMTDLVPDAES